MAEAEQFAAVIVDAPGLGALDYRVPEGMLLAPGDRVIVPLGTRKVPGIVTGLSPVTEVPAKKLRRVAAVLSDTIPLHAEWLALTRFAALYYQRGWGESAVPALPLFMRRAPGVRHESWLKKARAIGPAGGEPGPRPQLNDEQAEACRQVLASGGYVPWVLFGVTGSGKTEVYLHLIEETLVRDPEAQVLLMVPEINLTPQLEARVRARFPDELVVAMHSDFPDGERARSWLAVHEGRARVLVGTRMSIFASFRKLALVIVDEEHDTSFKAGDGLRFSGRDLAVWRAWKNRCPVILGSATPSIETWAKVRKGDYKLLTLTKRASAEATLPAIRLVNPNRKGARTLLTPDAAAAMEATLMAGRQVLVFLNRRGYAPVLSCPSCGWVSTCRRCSTFTVFHKGAKRLVCHHCGWQTGIPPACPKCGDPDILPKGTGTERIEEELAVRFPDRRVLRIDRDSVSTRHEAEEAFRRVHAGEVDILVGTQMVAKGHDFANVGLVVVLNPDAQMLSPATRAREQLFATLMQVAGRAGRAGAQGEVLIQTRFQDDPLFAALARQDYVAFADAVLEDRRANMAVPYVHQAMLYAEAKSLAEAEFFLAEAAEIGMREAPPEVRIYDPVPMPLMRLMNVERAQLLVEADERPALQAFLARWRQSLRARAGVEWTMEVDPLEA